MLCLKNLFRAKSARFIVTVCASAFIALAAGISFSCSFLEDDGFFDKIEGEVSVANADKMNVYLRYASIKFGKTTPADAASYQVKNNVAFSVTAVTNSDYAFYRWAAFSTKDFDVAKQHMSMVYANDDDYYANFGSLELDASVVKFENPRAETTNVTVLQTRDDIWIMPVIAVRPTIAGTFPGTSQIPVRNTKLRVQFSKPMDIESFEGNFIISQATRAADFSLNETDISEKFKMEINEKGNLVTFSFRDTAEMFNPAVVVRLYFTDDVADSTGYTMADSKTLEWNIGTYVDTLPPLITEMTAGIGSDCSKFASTPTRLAKTATDDLSNSLYTGELLTHRVKNKINLYVYAQDIAQANGERMESDVLMLGFRAKSITDLEGNAIDGNAEGNFIPNVIDTYAAGQNLSEINGAFRAITGGKSAGCLYTYDLSSLPDGLIQIEVYAVDSTGNDGLTGYDESIDDADGMGNGPRSVFVIKDNRAPAIENELEKIKSSSIVAPFGWYNKLTIDSVEIYDEAANPIRDFGHQKLAAAHENLKWICHLGSSTDWVAEADSADWVPVSERYKIGAAAVDGDGEVSVTIRLMDDLGNISKAMQISSVHCDNTVPETGKIYCVDASGAQGLNSTKDVVVPESMLIKVPFTEDLCGVKVFGLTIKASDGKQVENAFEHASILYSVEESPEKAEAVAIEADTSSLQDVLNSKGNVGASIFPNGIESLHVLQSSYNTGIFYIKNLTLGEADGMYTVTITLYDSALNKAGEKTVMLAHDTMPPVVNRVVIKNVVPRLVYGENETTYWLPGSAYDENKDAKYVTVAVTATENGSGVKVITLGENAHITEDTSFIIEGRTVSSDRCTIDAKTNTVTLFDYEQPDLYKQTGSIGFELTNIRLDKPNSEEGNKVSVSLQDFVDNTGSNENAGNFDLYIDDTSTSPIYQVFSDSQIPAIAEKSPALTDGKADSATDEKTFAEARLVSVYTDTKNVDLSLKLSPETNGSGVRSLSLSNGLFTGETAVYVDGKLLAQTECTLDGSIVTFVNYVFTAANTFKFTNVELQGSDDGLQLISITATDFTGWVSKEVSTPMITLDRAAPVVGEVTWHLKEGVYGVSKAAVVSNMDLCLPFTEVMTGVKVLRMDPKLNDSSSSATPFDSADFAIKYISNADIDALAESAGEGGETKPADTATLIENAKLLKAEEDYTVKDNYITFTEPQKYTSGLFVLQNIKVADTFEDNKSYKINLHLADAALNGCTADGTIDLESDSTSPKIQRIFINRLIARTQPGETVDSYWISKEDFEEAGKVPAKLELELTIAESGSGVKTVELGENLRLTAASEITCGTTKLVKESDYKVSSDFATITLITNSKPTFRSENGDFTVTITNATLTAEGENKISVKLTDFALNTDGDSKSSDIAYKADSTETVPSVFVDFTAPLLLEGGVKIVDRGGSEAINGTADADANTVALEGFTNEKLVNVALKTAASDAGETKRSGVKHLVISSGARFTSSSKFYYKDLAAADTAALTHADAATNGDGYEEITGVERSSDNLTATLPYSYACENVCEFIITNVELAGEEGENQVSIYPVDLTGWSDSEKAVNDKITLDTTAPAWGNNANAAVVMGTIGENGNDADYVWPKTSGARILASDGEVYFYKRPQGTESEPIYLTVNASDTNFYGLYFVSEASDKSSGAVAIAAKESNKAILTNITDVKFDASSNHEYTIVLKDRAGNISTETKSVHVVKDGEAEIVNDDDESSSLQNNMEYKESRENYHIFKTSVPMILTREESDGVDRVSSLTGYAVYYNDGNGGNDGVNPVTIEVNLSKHKEKNFTINSGVAYYAINGSTTAPTAVLEGEYSAPASALQNWNKWIPFTSSATSLTLYPKNDGTSPLRMRLWFKDNVGNVSSVEIKQKAEDGLKDEPDIWICDNTIPQNANGTADGFVPENSQLTANGLDFEYMMPDHMWKIGSTPASAELKVMNASGIKLEKGEGMAENRLFFTDDAKLTLVISNEPSETVATESGNADSENWAVKLFLYPSNSSTKPSRDVLMTWINEEANKNKYFYGIPGTDGKITLTNIEYPKECSETTPYIYVVAEDRVGNINISKLNVKVNAAEYVSSGTAPAAKDYWYGKFIYSADEEAPQIWLGGTGVHGNGTKVDVNADSFSSAADIAKLVPYNAGRRPYVDTTAGKTWISSNKYSLTANSLAGYNTKHDYSENDARRLFFYVDVDTEIPYAYYYSHDSVYADKSTISGKASDPYSSYSKWAILDGTSAYEGKVPVIIGNLSAMAGTDDARDIYLHVADKLGRVKTVKMAGTKWQIDNTDPEVNFTGLKMNDTKGLYRLEGSSTSLKITFSAEALKEITEKNNTVRVYIPTSYISDAKSGLYGCSWEEHLLKSSDEDEDCKDENGYYLEFDTADKDKNGSLYIANTANKKFYIFDKVGNRKDVSINSSVDNKPPVLSMKFARYNTDAVTFDQGKIYDASTTNSTKLLDCSTETELSAGTFTGTTGTIGYSLENPYVVYSNAKSSVTSDGYIKGIFGAEDMDGNDEKQLITEVTVKTCIITSNGMSTITTSEGKIQPNWIDVSSLVNGFLHQDAELKVSTLEMPIYLDGSGNTADDSSVKGDAFRGKLYTITIKDSGGNETTIYLKVMRDRTGPKFKYDATNYVDASHHAEVKGGVGYYGGKVFYQTSGANQAYVELAKADNYSDGSVSKGAAYDEDCGVVVTDRLLREYIYDSTLKNAYDAPVSGTAKYLLTGTGNYPYYYYLYAEDKLGNSTKVDLYVDGHNISSQAYYKDVSKPTISSNFTVDTKTFGKFDATEKILYFNYDSNNPKNNGFQRSAYTDRFQGFDIKFATSDNSSVTDVSAAAKYCFIWNEELTSLPDDFEDDLKKAQQSRKYKTKQASASDNSFNIAPNEYWDSSKNEGAVYFYVVDYAKNLSNPNKITIKVNDQRPGFTINKDSDFKNIIENNGVYYFNKESKINVTITDSEANITWYGLTSTVNDFISDRYFADTLKYLTGTNSKKTIETVISFANFGKNPSISGYGSSESIGATSFSGTLFAVSFNSYGNNSYAYWLPVGPLPADKFDTAPIWTYDATVLAPRNLALPEPASGETKLTYLDSANNKVFYSKAVDDSTDKTFYVNIDFPADVAGIKGYKIAYLGTSDSAPNASTLVVNEFVDGAIAPSAPESTTATSRTIPISSQTVDKKVYIYAVDGLGNVSEPYTFTISKISNAPNVIGIEIDRSEISVGGSGAEFVVKDATMIYVNANATSIKIKPVIDGSDITGIKGFARSRDGIDDSENTDGTYTINISSLANNAKATYPIYARNGIGLYSATGYNLTIIRDATGPSVSKITLVPPTGGSANLHAESGVNNLYYNNVEIKISSVTAADPVISTVVDGVGKGRSPSEPEERYSLVINTDPSHVLTDADREFITNDHDYIADAAMFTLKLLNDGTSSYSKSTDEICIAAFDKLGNIKLTPLSAVEITVGTDVDKTISNFIYDNVAPTAPTSVAFSYATASVNNGWYVKNETESSLDLYYNIANINVTPSQGTSADDNFLGFKVGTDGAVANDMTLTLSTGDAEIYAVDKAGNVSATAYVIHMIQDNSVASPTLPDNSEENPVINTESQTFAFWSSAENKVYYKEGNTEERTSVKINVNFASDDVTGIKGYKTKVGSGEISGQVTASGGTNVIEIAVPATLSTDNEFTAKIYAVDNVGNINGEGEALDVTFKKLTNAADVTGFDKNSIVLDTGRYRLIDPESDGNMPVIYVNGAVGKVRFKPTFTNADVTGIKGFAPAADGMVTDGTVFTITVNADDTSATGTEYNIYAVNNVGLYSANPYKVKIIRDTTGPVVSEITLTKPDGKTVNYDSTDKKLYYNDANVYISAATANDIGAGVTAAENRVYLVTTAEEGSPTITAGTELKIGERSEASKSVFIAAKDLVGNVSYTPVSKIKVTIAGTTPAVEIAAVDDDDTASFTFAFDNTSPTVPSSIALTPDSEENTKAGNGVYLGAASVDSDGKYSSTIYYNTAILGENPVEVTPRQETPDVDLAGFCVRYNNAGDYSEVGATVMVDLTKGTPRIYAVDKAGNRSSRYKINLTEDKTAASALTQVTEDSDKIFYATTKNGRATYYTPDYSLKLSITPSNSPVVAYLVKANGSGDAPSDGWTYFETPVSAPSNDVAISLCEINDIKTTCALWIKDAVGNTKAYNNSKTNTNALGNPGTDTDPSKPNLKNAWWHSYSKPESLTLESNMENKVLTLTGFTTAFPVKSLKFENFILTESDMKITGIKAYASDSDDYTTPAGNSGNITKTDGAFTLEFNNSNAIHINQITKLEITFDKGALYYDTGAKITVNSNSESVECDMTNFVHTFQTPVYTLEPVGTAEDPDYKLTITGLWSEYKTRYFSFLYLKDDERDGISFDSGASLKMKTVIAYNGTEQKSYLSDKSPFTLNGSYPDGKYCIDFGEWTSVNADKIEIVFDSEPHFASDIEIELAQTQNDYKRFALKEKSDTDPEPDTSIFTRFIDNLSSGFTSIFSGRSMTHEELEALKEAKAEKARARAAEKAAKKAAKKAARDAKKNAEIASASPNQGESWTGLSGEFDSASSELDSALAKMKDSSGPEAKASDEVSSKNGIIKVKSGKKNAVSNSKELITDSTVRKTENHGNRMIYVFGFLAVLGVISGIFAKKVRKNSKKS